MTNQALNEKFNIAVLASGNGTDLEAIFESIDAGELENVKVQMVISDKKESPALTKASVRNVNNVFLDPKKYTDKFAYDDALVELLKTCESQVDLICLIGYKRILTPNFIKAYRGRIINVHPSLLPKYGGIGWFGMKVHEAVIENKEKWSGMTIHYVDFGVDSGPHIIQEKIQVLPNETPEELKDRIQALEKIHYPRAIKILQQKSCKIRT